MHDMSRASDDGPAHEFENLSRFVRTFEGFNK